MLGLTEQIGGAHFTIYGFISDDQSLGRTGEQVDANTAK